MQFNDSVPEAPNVPFIILVRDGAQTAKLPQGHARVASQCRLQPDAEGLEAANLAVKVFLVPCAERVRLAGFTLGDGIDPFLDGERDDVAVGVGEAPRLLG